MQQADETSDGDGHQATDGGQLPGGGAQYSVSQQRNWLAREAQWELGHRRRTSGRAGARMARFVRRDSVADADPLDRLVDGEAERERAELYARVRELVASLAPELRAALELRAAGLKGPEVAVRLGISHELVRKRQMQARRLVCQQLLGPGEAEPEAAAG